MDKENKKKDIEWEQICAAIGTPEVKKITADCSAHPMMRVAGSCLICYKLVAKTHRLAYGMKATF